MEKKPKISVIFATFRRTVLLAQTLESLSKLNLTGLDCEIIVVDNCPLKSSRSVIENYENKLPIIYLSESQPGKNAAINTGLKIAKGDLLVFTDDDIIFDCEWLREVYQGSIRHPDAHLFGGKILPLYPENYKEIDKNVDFDHPFLRSAYGVADWDQAEGAIKIDNIWGGNMAVRRDVFNNTLMFNPEIGPNGENYIMGGESEFLKRAESSGYSGVYLPKSLVFHQIRIEQISLKWLQNRAYKSGRAQAILNKIESKILFGAPRYLWRKYILALLREYGKYIYNKTERFSNTINFHTLKGKISQHRRREK